jgi:hypothetical protein
VAYSLDTTLGVATTIVIHTLILRICSSRAQYYQHIERHWCKCIAECGNYGEETVSNLNCLIQDGLACLHMAARMSRAHCPYERFPLLDRHANCLEAIPSAAHRVDWRSHRCARYMWLCGGDAFRMNAPMSGPAFALSCTQDCHNPYQSRVNLLAWMRR